jgi:hypothetical protein
VANQIKWKIERRNCRNDTARHAQGKSKFLAPGWIRVQWHRLTMKPFCLFRRSHDRLNRPARFAATFGDNLTFLSGNDLAKFFVARRHKVRRLAQNLPALIGGQLGHHFRAAFGERQSIFQISRIRPRHSVNNRVVKGVANFYLFRLIDPLSCNKILHDDKPPMQN